MKIRPLGIMLLLSVCISSSFLDQSLAIIPEDIEQKAELLERQGEYETARAFLKNEYLKTGRIDILLSRSYLTLPRNLRFAAVYMGVIVDMRDYMWGQNNQLAL